jgi:O-succinylbenzoic acid--CoA ligase
MPLWRSRLWGAEHRRLSPALMKQPQALRAACQQWPGWGQQPALVSLVPTQLKRLMDHPDGVAWLQQLALVWVGGASLPASLAERARRLGLPLSPCYGSTETAAMVAAQTPDRFLQGDNGCGAALDDVALAVDAAGVLRVRTARLALARWRHGQWASLTDTEGWWQTGDAAVLTPKAATGARLTIKGRMDGAIHSGGETVFPEQLAQRLMHQAHGLGLPLETVLLLPVASEEWGQRLVALVKQQHGGEAMPWPQLQTALAGISRQWMPAERPCAWYRCQELETTAAGKWQLGRWHAWVVAQSQGHADG